MSLIDRLIFPRPKYSTDKSLEKNLVYIPLFKDFKLYEKLKHHLLQLQAIRACSKSTSHIPSLTELDRPQEKKLNFDDTVTPMDVSISFVESQKAPKAKLEAKGSDNIYQEPELNLDGQLMKLHALTTKKSPGSYVFDNDSKYHSESVSRSSMLKRAQTALGSQNFDPLPLQPKTSNFNSLEVQINIDYREFRKHVFDYLPCAYFEFSSEADTMIYFHSNAEDLSMLESVCETIRDKLKVNVLAMEYCGYSVYKGSQTNAERIKFDCLALIHFLRDTLRVQTKRIILAGRSMGSGPSLYLASHFDFKMVTVVSGFLSIKKVAQDKFKLFGLLVDHYFNNEEAIVKNKSPLLILHGKNDQIIRYQHAECLYDLAVCKAKILLFDDMSHNSFNFWECFLNPTKRFLDETNRRVAKPVSKECQLKMVRSMFTQRIFGKIHS